MSAEQQNNYAKGEAVLSDVLQGGSSGESVGEQLFGVSDLLRQNPSLVKALIDVSRPTADKEKLAEDVFAGQVGQAALRILKTLVQLHWSEEAGFVATVDQLATDAFLMSAVSSVGVEAVAQQLVDTYTLILDNRALRVELSDLGDGTGKQRAQFTKELFGDYLDESVLGLVAHASGNAKHGRLAQTLREYAQRATQLEKKSLAIATSARQLSQEQAQRLQKVAERKWDRPMVLVTVVDPALVGGFRLDVGDESVDTTIKQDITAAKLALTR